jgi:hypothetical protein
VTGIVTRMLTPKPRWGATPSGRLVQHLEVWERVSREAHRAYMQDGLTLGDVADVLNRRYAKRHASPKLGEPVIRLMFDDFELPLKPQDVIPERGGIAGRASIARAR